MHLVDILFGNGGTALRLLRKSTYFTLSARGANAKCQHILLLQYLVEFSGNFNQMKRFIKKVPLTLLCRLNLQFDYNES